VIFAGAGVLLLVDTIPDYLYSNRSHMVSSQAVKDVVASQDTLIDIFDRIEGFFRRLETYTEVPTTDAMRDVILKVMVEVLGIFAIVTKEMKQNPASELSPDDMFPITDQDLEKFLKKLIGRRDVEDALSRLDKLTREEFQTAIAQVLKVTHDVDDGVKNVGEKVDGVRVQVKDIGDKVNVAIESTSRFILYSQTPSKAHIRLDGQETKALVIHAANNMEKAKRSRFFCPLAALSHRAETTLQGCRQGRTTERGCLRLIHPLIKISLLVFNTRGRRCGSSREVSSRSGGPSQQNSCCGFMGNVRPSVPLSLYTLTDIGRFNHRSRFRKEYPLVRRHLSGSPLRSLHSQLVRRSFKTYWRFRRLD